MFENTMVISVVLKGSLDQGAGLARCADGALYISLHYENGQQCEMHIPSTAPAFGKAAALLDAPDFEASVRRFCGVDAL